MAGAHRNVRLTDLASFRIDRLPIGRQFHAFDAEISVLAAVGCQTEIARRVTLDELDDPLGRQHVQPVPNARLCTEAALVLEGFSEQRHRVHPPRARFAIEDVDDHLALALPLNEAETYAALTRLDPLWNEMFPAEQARIVALLVERVDIGSHGLNVRLRTDGLAALVREMRPEVGAAA